MNRHTNHQFDALSDYESFKSSCVLQFSKTCAFVYCLCYAYFRFVFVPFNIPLLRNDWNKLWEAFFANSEDSTQPGRTPRMIKVFANRTNNALIAINRYSKTRSFWPLSTGANAGLNPGLRDASKSIFASRDSNCFVTVLASHSHFKLQMVILKITVWPLTYNPFSSFNFYEFGVCVRSPI